MTRTALLVGGTGQIGRATAQELIRAGWHVEVANRGPCPADLKDLGVVGVTLDRNDTDGLITAARGHDLVLDAVAFTPEHGRQLAQLAGEIGSMVVISTGAVYAGESGVSAEQAGVADFPDYPVPIPETWHVLSGRGDDYGSRKAAVERLLLDTPDLPVSILRPGTLHGPFSSSLHQWSFIKRILDQRPHAVLAYNGESRFATSAAANVARLVRLCAEAPAVRVLNAADDDALTVAEIAARIASLMGAELPLVTFPGPPREDGLGFNPWGIPKPIVLSMERARSELGYTQAISYDAALELDIQWAVAAVAAAESQGDTWQDVFPGVVARYGADRWFPYELEDRYVRQLSSAAGRVAD